MNILKLNKMKDLITAVQSSLDQEVVLDSQNDLMDFTESLERIYGKQALQRTLLFHALASSGFDDSRTFDREDFEGSEIENFIIDFHKKWLKKQMSE
jgi:hypothetical protein